MKKIITLISLLWQVPLFVLSFFFYRLMRLGIQKGANKDIKRRFKGGESLKWLGFSEILKQPMALPFIMVTGPRWNCHAVIGILGPFNLQSTIDIQVETAQKSAQQWTIIIYSWKNKKQTVTFLSSATTTNGELERQINLAPGQYSIGLRYYNCQEEVAFPAVTIDGKQRVTSCSMKTESKQYQSFLRQIQNHRGIFFYGLHYYIFHLLGWQRCFPKSFVRKEYLPVGNPETSFYYGRIRKGDILQVDFDEGLINTASIYITFYNLCSFPVFWEDIIRIGYQSKPIPCDGHYLIRVHGRGRRIEWLQICCKVISKGRFNVLCCS